MVNIKATITGKKFYCVEYKKWVLGHWWYCSNSVQFNLKEATASKVLLKNGHSLYDPFKPSTRCEQLNLTIE